MRFKLFVTAAVLGSVALFALGTPGNAQQRSQRSSGHAARIDNNDTIWLVAQVKDLDAQSPIANARVEVDGHPAQIRTNQDGKFFVRGTRGSKHTVAVRALGYEPYTFDWTEAEESGEPTEVWLIRTSGQSNLPHMTRGVEKKSRARTN